MQRVGRLLLLCVAVAFLAGGTFDLLPGVTYNGRTSSFSWGDQATGVLRLGRNSNDYRLGNELELTGWGAVKLAPWVSTSLRLDFRRWGNIAGADPALNPALVPTADPGLRAGRRLDGLVGLNFVVPWSFLRNQRLAVEMGWPLYQRLDGPQLKTDWTLVAGWQYAF